MTVRKRQVVTLAARTATGQSSAIPVRDGNIGLMLTCITATGTTPTLDVSIQWSADGTRWGGAQSADTFIQLTTSGNGAKSFFAKAVFYRIVWTITGTTPSFTFAIDEVAW
jgi:hypothetical protein